MFIIIFRYAISVENTPFSEECELRILNDDSNVVYKQTYCFVNTHLLCEIGIKVHGKLGGDNKLDDDIV